MTAVQEAHPLEHMTVLKLEEVVRTFGAVVIWPQ